MNHSIFGSPYEEWKETDGDVGSWADASLHAIASTEERESLYISAGWSGSLKRSMGMTVPDVEVTEMALICPSVADPANWSASCFSRPVNMCHH
ncbi:hypothetical protein FHS14_001766 [Paenibacillus baekrokdamisoli]|nr:hypothetical protein [Paenibacillus baekrokdamisoli]MBB3068779.1 hypothetical protein [Paenibacillus baekrokdamisoli]